MNLKAGYPYSLIKNGLPFDYPKLEKDIKTDVLVMGGGISGSLTAHYLIQAGIDCTVVDARTIGLGSTCASTSLLQYEIDTPLHKLMGMVGEYTAVRSYQLCGEAILKLEKLADKIGLEDFTRKKSLYFAAHKKDIPSLKKEYAARKENGFKVSYLQEDDIVKQFGFAAPAAILSDLGASTDAYLFTHHLLKYNIKKGLVVYDRTPVISIKHTAKNVILKTQNGYKITAKKLVYATGYEVVNYIKKHIVTLNSTYAMISEPFPSAPSLGKSNPLIWNTADAYLYIRTTDDNRILIGGRDEKFYSPAKRDKLISIKTKQLAKDFNKLFPFIPMIPEFSWTGTFGSTKDGLPFIGTYKNLPNSFFSLGFGGNGITFSQIAGEIIAQIVQGKKNNDAEIFCFERI